MITFILQCFAWFALGGIIFVVVLSTFLAQHGRRLGIVKLHADEVTRKAPTPIEQIPGLFIDESRFEGIFIAATFELGLSHSHASQLTIHALARAFVKTQSLLDQHYRATLDTLTPEQRAKFDVAIALARSAPCEDSIMRARVA